MSMSDNNTSTWCKQINTMRRSLRKKKKSRPGHCRHLEVNETDKHHQSADICSTLEKMYTESELEEERKKQIRYVRNTVGEIKEDVQRISTDVRNAEQVYSDVLNMDRKTEEMFEKVKMEINEIVESLHDMKCLLRSVTSGCVSKSQYQSLDMAKKLLADIKQQVDETWNAVDDLTAMTKERQVESW